MYQHKGSSKFSRKFNEITNEDVEKNWPGETPKFGVSLSGKSDKKVWEFLIGLKRVYGILTQMLWKLYNGQKKETKIDPSLF